MLDTRTELTKLQFFTMSTCGEACWEAREDVCRCSCNGKNHGVLRNGNERPARTCKIQGYWYELHTVTDYGTGKSLCQELRKDDAVLHPENYRYYNGTTMVYYDSTPGDAFHCKAPSKSQKNWTEAINSGVTGYMVFIWKRIPAPVQS